MPKKNFKYYDVYGKIKEDLIAGKYPSGSMLPTEDELVELYQASKTTIRHATKLLESEHFIERQQGRGTVILEFQQYRSRHKYHGDTVKVKYRTNGPGIPTNIGGYIEKIPVPAEVGERMQLPAGAPVYRIQWLQLIDGRAFGISVNYFHAEMTPGLGKLKFRPSSDIYTFFEQEYGLHLDHIEDVLDTVLIDEEAAAQLGINTGTPVLLIRRTGYCEKGIFQYSESILRSDIFQMSIRLDSDYFKMKK